MENANLESPTLEQHYAAFLREEMVTVDPAIKDLAKSPLPWGSLPGFSEVTVLENEGEMNIETGYSVAEDGSIAVAVKTLVPETSPEMWDWWFGWHGSEDERYKLWHPEAHISAEWEDGRKDSCYIGRN
ncbi:MAG: hypothetical protein AAFY76_15405, partial [Cyanobacteria bacterium J06649_11]